MTIAVTQKPNPIAGTVETHGAITFDSSYPTGGEAVAASDFGLPFVHEVDFRPRTDGYSVRYDRTAGKAVVTYDTARALVGTGAAAGNVTVTGIRTTDVIQSVLLLCNTATVALDLTAEFAVCAANTIGNAAGTPTAGGKVVVMTRNAEVPNTTDLSTLIVDYVARYFENGA